MTGKPIVRLAIFAPVLFLIAPASSGDTVNRATVSSSDGRVTVTCDKSCSPAQRAELQSVVQILEDVEVSDCFSKFFTDQDHFAEDQGKTPKQLLHDLQVTKISTTLTIWRPTFAYVFADAKDTCGFENGDGKVHAKAHCYDRSSPGNKAKTIAHELAHQIGYTHLTGQYGKNVRKGNEYSVPYTVDRAFEKCRADATITL
jgi:hypothetical protein